MDLGNSGAREFSVSLESKVRNKQAQQFFSAVSLLSRKCVSRRWKEWFPVSKSFFLKLFEFVVFFSWATLNSFNLTLWIMYSIDLPQVYFINQKNREKEKSGEGPFR